MNSFALPDFTIHNNIPLDLISRKRDEWIDKDNRLRLLPASEYLSQPPIVIQAVGNFTARYVFPTVELIDWLRQRIGTRRALEIGAGQGDLGRLLGIPMVDNFCQQRPEVKAYYAAFHQVPTFPPVEVERMDAVEAVKKYRPQVVIGAFITHKFRGGAAGNEHGPVEEDIIANCETYIHIGNDVTHKAKAILGLPHESHCFDWLVTRAKNPSQNVIWIWNNGA